MAAADSASPEVLRLNAERLMALNIDSAANPFRRRDVLSSALENMAVKPLTFVAGSTVPRAAGLQLPDIESGAAFDSILARERAGNLSFTPSTDDAVLPRAGDAVLPRAEARSAAPPPVPVLSDAFPPAIEVAHEAGRTVVRVVQTLLTGEIVQFVSWIPTPRTSDPHSAGTLRSLRPLDDGRRELVLRTTTGWLAIRGDLSAAQLAGIADDVVYR